MFKPMPVDQGGALLEIKSVRHGPVNQIGLPQPIGRYAVHDAGLDRQRMSVLEALEADGKLPIRVDWTPF